MTWLAGPGFAISPHLPPGECSSESVKRYLANLLPEGKWLEELSLAHQIAKSNIFALIAVLGEETTGALIFRLKHQASSPPATAFLPVSARELQDRIGRRQDISIARWDGKTRLSVAGVQDKLPLLIKESG